MIHLFISLFLMHIFHVGSFFGQATVESLDVTLAFAWRASFYFRRLNVQSLGCSQDSASFAPVPLCPWTKSVCLI